MKKARIYTRTGDAGTTSLVGGKRALKSSQRIEAYGTVDELNSFIGLVTSSPECPDREKKFLTAVQNHLFDIGSYLACPPDSQFQLPAGVTPARMDAIETAIDTLDAALPRIDRFILPGGSEISARCHTARAVCRRAERRIIALSQNTQVAPEVIAYINRLSDYLFTLARYLNIITDTPEIFWQKDC